MMKGKAKVSGGKAGPGPKGVAIASTAMVLKAVGHGSGKEGVDLSFSGITVKAATDVGS